MMIVGSSLLVLLLRLGSADEASEWVGSRLIELEVGIEKLSTPDPIDCLAQDDDAEPVREWWVPSLAVLPPPAIEAR